MIEEINKSIWEIGLSVIIGQSILTILFFTISPWSNWNNGVVFVDCFCMGVWIFKRYYFYNNSSFASAFFTTVIAGGIATFLLRIKFSLLKEEIIIFSKNQKPGK